MPCHLIFLPDIEVYLKHTSKSHSGTKRQLDVVIRQQLSGPGLCTRCHRAREHDQAKLT